MSIRRNVKSKRGFTLVELMVVVAILGVLGLVVTQYVIPKLTKSQQVVAKANIETLSAEIKAYRINNFRIPDSLEVLLEPDPNNADEPYLENSDALLDPWGNEYVYIVESKSKYEIKSLGADGMEGGDGQDRDISSRDTRARQEY